MARTTVDTAAPTAGEGEATTGSASPTEETTAPAETTSTTDTTATDGQQPAGEPAPEPEASPADTAETPADEENLGDGGKNALKAIREERDGFKRQLEELQASSVTKTDFDAVTAERDSLKTEIETLKAGEQTRVATEAIKAAAVEAGAVSPAAIARLIDASAFTPDDPNAAALVAKLKEDSDYAALFGVAEVKKSGLGTHDASSRREPAPFFSEQQVNRMSTADYEKHREAIFASMKQW